jgi:hypothetical protein
MHTPVDADGARVNKPSDPCGQASVQDRPLRRDHLVDDRLGHTLSSRRQRRGEMHDRRYRPPLEQGDEGADIREGGRGVFHGRQLLGRQDVDGRVPIEVPIDDRDAVACAEQRLHDVGPDEAETAGDEHGARHRQAIVNSGS